MITKEMRVDEVLEMNESFANVLLDNGLPCVGCPGAVTETLEEAAESHDVDLARLLRALNAIAE